MTLFFSKKTPFLILFCLALTLTPRTEAGVSKESSCGQWIAGMAGPLVVGGLFLLGVYALNERAKEDQARVERVKQSEKETLETNFRNLLATLYFIENSLPFLQEKGKELERQSSTFQIVKQQLEKHPELKEVLAKELYLSIEENKPYQVEVLYEIADRQSPNRSLAVFLSESRDPRKDDLFTRPLKLAVELQREEIIEILLSRGAHFDQGSISLVRTLYKEKAIEKIASWQGIRALAQTVNEKKVNLTPEQKQLRAAAFGDRAEELEQIANTGVFIDSQDAKLQTALHAAIIKGANQRIVEILLKAGANPNLRDIFGNTPVHYAAHLLKSKNTAYKTSDYLYLLERYCRDRNEVDLNTNAIVTIKAKHTFDTGLENLSGQIPYDIAVERLKESSLSELSKSHMLKILEVSPKDRKKVPERIIEIVPQNFGAPSGRNEIR